MLPLARINTAFSQPPAQIFVSPPVDATQAADFKRFISAKNHLT
jgi:hypothetical protein